VLVWFGHAIVDFLLPPPNTVTVPVLIGTNDADAATTATRMNLSTTIIGHSTSDRYPKDVVIDQLPEAGAKVRAGRQISLIVSDGIVARAMPDLRYQSMREVGLDLSYAHLQLGGVTYQKSDIVPDGHVIDQRPAPLSNVVENQTVSLIVSKGGASSIVMPNFVGLPIADARALASSSGATLGQIVWTPLGRTAPAHGEVVRQTIPPGTRLPPFTPVSLQVSAGPHESGRLIHQAHVLISIPTGDVSKAGQPVRVALRVHDATGTYDAYRAYAQPGAKLDFTLTTIGTSIVDLYVDDALAGESRLGEEPPAVYNDTVKPTPTPGGR